MPDSVNNPDIIVEVKVRREAGPFYEWEAVLRDEDRKAVDVRFSMCWRTRRGAINRAKGTALSMLRSEMHERRLEDEALEFVVTPDDL